MTIKREELDKQEVDFSDVASGRRLPPVHPGEILRDEFLTPMEISVYRLAQAIKVSRPRLNDIVLGRRSITTDTALRLGRYFDMTPEFWINLQTRYDLDVAERTMRHKIEREVEPRTTLDATILD
ncbi:MAG: HigA family addiction module antidote protein [Gemmatimonadetes bacterium]|nr:HigA family addiction module antidote protein [Gemmatimonadota bacterium]MYC73258.1 HigA family addiction module antidote protein [Gemmatimonadota bacterium]MYI63568.1 HigA family addiction module antidote protein [Gemmatimonadota bacterium]